MRLRAFAFVLGLAPDFALGRVLTFALLAHAIRTGYEAACVTDLRAHTLPPLAVGLGIAALAYFASFFPINIASVR